MNLSQRQTGGRSTQLRKTWRGEQVGSGRDVPFSVSWEPLCRQRVRTRWCVFSLWRKPKFLHVSEMAFYKHLQTLSLILTPHVKMERTRPGKDGAGKEESRRGK